MRHGYLDGPPSPFLAAASMVRASLFSAAFLPSLLACAQAPDLVPNGGFEQVTKEPKTFDQLSSATGWSNVTIGFSEVFDKGAPARTVGIPENEYGRMDPQEGERYAGFFAWKDDQRGTLRGDDPFEAGWNVYSEYPTIELSAPLTAGHTYAVSFFVALSGNSDRAVSGIGVHVSPLPLKYNNRKFMQERPQVSADGILAEKGKWVEISGSFVADGDERYLVLGTFPMASFGTRKVVEGPDNQYAYYYIDHVVLKELPAPLQGR